jgi:hypothetical protein
MTPMDDWAATAPRAPKGDTPSPPRVGLRLGLILLGLLVTLLIGQLFLQRGSPTATVQVADLPSSATAVIEDVQDAGDDIDLIVFVAQPGQPGTTGAGEARRPLVAEDIWQAVQGAESPPAMLVVSEHSLQDVGNTLPSTVRVVDRGGSEIHDGSSPFGFGLLRLTIWTLALLAMGALLGWALFFRPRPVARHPVTAAPTPLDKDRPPRTVARPPTSQPRLDDEATRLGVGLDAHPRPARGDLDLRPFQKRSAAESTQQCPKCGWFRPQARMDGGGSRYRCAHCDEAWQVRAGEAWPTVVIRPRHRRVD